MIQVDNLSISYHGEPLFTNAQFTLQPGERCGLVGRNGSGKTTLFRLLVQEETPDTGTITIRKQYRIGMLRQHIHFTENTVLAQAALGLPPNERDHLYKAETILSGLGFLESDFSRPPSDFSGGFHLRLHLAQLLIAEPDCLLLDEPTNYLDILSIRYLERFLKSWRGECILISHDRAFMDEVCTHTMGIHRHKIYKLPCDTLDFYQYLLQEEELYERTRINQEKKRAHDQQFIDRFGAKATKATQAQARVKRLAKLPVLKELQEIRELDFAFQYAEFPGRNLLSCRDLTFSYSPDANQPLIHPLTLSLERGQRLAIIGKNGRGKSTLLRLFAQDLTPQEGTLILSERTRMGYFGQTHINRLHPKHTIEEEIACANPLLTRTAIKGICGLMMFSGATSEKQTSLLSGGEKARVLLGKIIATPCNLLLLDEPTHHLDMQSVEALIDAMQAFPGTIVLVTHNEGILTRIPFDKILICGEGKQELFLGSYTDFLEKKGWDEEKPTFKTPMKRKDSDKQQRVSLLTERAKALKPLDERIAQSEQEIARLEKELVTQQNNYAAHAKNGESYALQEVAKALHLTERTLDQLYINLEGTLTERDALYADYTKRISAYDVK